MSFANVSLETFIQNCVGTLLVASVSTLRLACVKVFPELSALSLGLSRNSIQCDSFSLRYQMRDWEGKALRMVKKDLLTQKSWAHFRSLKGGHRRRHPSLSSSLITGHKPSTSTSLSISRGEIDRQVVAFALKEKYSSVLLSKTAIFRSRVHTRPVATGG